VSRTLIPAFVLVVASCGETSSAVPAGRSAPRRLDAGVHQFDIRFDYRFDAAGFFSPERRLILEAAAREWETRLVDDFPEIPAGTKLAVKDVVVLDGAIQELTSLEPIDDLLVFVGCTNELDARESARTRTATLLTSAHGAEFRADLERRWHGQDYEPWTSAIAFGCDTPFFWDGSPETLDDIPNDRQDFASVAMHELGHALGVMTSEAYRSFMSADGSEFLGPRSIEVFGGPVPLERDGHVGSHVTYQGQRVLMDDTLSPRTRVYPTKLDLALLEDIGYRAAPEFR
jgi:hypothetical protein